MQWKEGNAEDFPFEDEIFGAVLTNFGHMFSFYCRNNNKRNVIKIK
jgi:ubiquinone/menaquinone biosynthesis C-methylase UbiE